MEVGKEWSDVVVALRANCQAYGGVDDGVDDTQLQTLNDLGIEVDANHYNQSQKEKLVTVLYNNRDLFTDDICNLPGTDLVTHTIDRAETHPIRQRHSPEARKELDKQIERLLDADIIEESQVQWCL